MAAQAFQRRIGLAQQQDDQQDQDDRDGDQEQNRKESGV
jgi:hypothetical protein